jgi:hypothetical protein
MTDTKKRLHSEATSEIEVSVKETKTESKWVYFDSRAMHLLKVGTIIVQKLLWTDSYSFYVVDSFTKTGAPRCFLLRYECATTTTDLCVNKVYAPIHERVAGAKPKVLRRTKDGLCSRNAIYMVYDEEYEYGSHRCLYD